MQWQPIETAPRDGQMVLLACAKTTGERVGIGAYSARYNAWNFVMLGLQTTWDDTCFSHWAPITNPGE